MTSFEKVDIAKSSVCPTCGHGGEHVQYWLQHIVQTNSTYNALYYIQDGGETDTISVSQPKIDGTDESTLLSMIDTQFRQQLSEKYPDMVLPK